jgi:hypothetical protein
MLLFSSIGTIVTKNKALLRLSKLIYFSTMSSSKIAAVAQMRATNDKKHNLTQVEEIIRKSKEMNASVST